MIIYTLIDPAAPDVIRYVGKTARSPRRRLRDHIWQAVRGKHDRGTWKSNWIRSLLAAGRKPQLEAIAATTTEAALNDLELYYIAHFRALGFPLTNGTDGGDGATGRHFSAEVRRKIGDSNRGKRRSPEFVQRMRERPISDETRRRIVEAARRRYEGISDEDRRTKCARAISADQRALIGRTNRGRQLSPETRRKMGLARMGHVVSEETRRKIGDRVRDAAFRKRQPLGLSVVTE